MNIIAFDPGVRGGIAWFKNGAINAKILPVVDSCLDESAVYDLLLEIKPELAIIEKQWGRSGDKQIFALAHTYGAIKGICQGLKIPYELVAATTWQSKILKNTKKEMKQSQVYKDLGINPKTKDISICHCLRHYPEVSLMKSDNPRCTKPHDGIADAICLLEYGLKYFGSIAA